MKPRAPGANYARPRPYPPPTLPPLPYPPTLPCPPPPCPPSPPCPAPCTALPCPPSRPLPPPSRGGGGGGIGVRSQKLSDESAMARIPSGGLAIVRPLQEGRRTWITALAENSARHQLLSALCSCRYAGLGLVSRYFSIGLVAPPLCLRHLCARMAALCCGARGLKFTPVVVVGSAALGA